MRNALIVLVVVALVLVALGAVNHGLLFDIDFVAGTWTAVSLFWVAVVTAGVVFVTGVVAAFLAQSGAVATRRKLEKELQGTYERLRAAEAQAAETRARAGRRRRRHAWRADGGHRRGAHAAGRRHAPPRKATPEAETAVTTRDAGGRGGGDRPRTAGGARRPTTAEAAGRGRRRTLRRPAAS